MADVVFPTDPQPGDIYTSGDSSWQWDGAKWVVVPPSMEMTAGQGEVLIGNADGLVSCLPAGTENQRLVADPSAYEGAEWVDVNAIDNDIVVQGDGSEINGLKEGVTLGQYEGAGAYVYVKETPTQLRQIATPTWGAFQFFAAGNLISELNQRLTDPLMLHLHASQQQIAVNNDSHAVVVDLDAVYIDNVKVPGDLIAKALLTAKGDVIAATAAGAPARVGVGTNGQVLTADSTQAAGVRWATPSSGGGTGLAPGWPSDGSTVFYGLPCWTYSSTGAITPAGNTDYFVPFLVEGNAIEISHVAVRVTTPVVGANFRAGIVALDYNLQGTGPVLLDTGPLSAGTTQVVIYQLPTPLRLPPGRYATLYNADQNGVGIQATIGQPAGIPFTMPATISLGQNHLWRKARTFGAFPASPTWNTVTQANNGINAYVLVRVSNANA